MSQAQIQSDLVTALKKREELKVSVLRMLLSEINYRFIAVQRELTEEDIINVIQREVKKRREAIESYRAGGRAAQAEQEEQELQILSSYLPQQMTEGEIRDEVAKILSGKDIKDFGQAMKLVSPVLKGRADGAVVAKIVRQIV